MSKFSYIDSNKFYVAEVYSYFNNGYALNLILQNGNVISINMDSAYEFEIGSLVTINENDNSIENAPDEFHIFFEKIGVVRVKSKTNTIVSFLGTLQLIPTINDVYYEEGNTVKYKSNYGVIDVLSDEPLNSFDIKFKDEIIIDKFKSNKSKKETFQDFGGFKDVVKRARELIELSLEKKDLLSEIGVRPIKGVLFTGAPGTGKTMLARIIANETDSDFYEIKGPEIISKWVGQSEEVLRSIFNDARTKDQAIIFFDEIDSVASQRDDNSHEASKRVVAQLLSLMDGFKPDNNIIVIATTNRKQDIDKALLRPGRFDWEINFPYPNLVDRFSILEVSAKNLNTEENLPFFMLAERTEGWSPAELSGIWKEAGLLAVAEDRGFINIEDFIGGFERAKIQKDKINGDSK